jgi:glutamate 5-kinase
VEEIKFGDNDLLSTLIAGLVDADLLIILSDVDGLYDRDPRVHKDALLQSEVFEITESMEENSNSRGIAFSKGGMITKLRGARICMAAGIPLVIANSSELNAIRRIIAGENLGTLFVPMEEKMQARKKWIAFGTVVQGKVKVDSGAANALLNKGKSLLASGIVDIEGDFERGTVVAVLNSDGQEIARGMVNYNADEIRRIAGQKSVNIEKILGEKDYDEVIHRNNLWVKC